MNDLSNSLAQICVVLLFGVTFQPHFISFCVCCPKSVYLCSRQFVLKY